MMADRSYSDTQRLDARDKVRGVALFAADDVRPGMLHGIFAVARIGKGRLKSLDTREAQGVPGVRLVLTHTDMAGIVPAGFLMGGGFAFQSFQPMLSDAIAYRGQPIALVIADTLEIARDAADRIAATYAAEPFQVELDSPAQDIVSQAASPLPKPMFADRVAGDADAAYAAAPIKVDMHCASPPQHQNPIELIATVAEWRDGTLIVHEGTQNAGALRAGLAKQLGIAPDKVQVISPYCGGGFGQKNSLQMHTVIAAVAARRLERPVKIVLPRAQIYHDTSFRPASRHRLRLGAQPDGKIVAAIHEIDSQTSRHDLFPAQYADLSARLHGIANFRGHERLVRTDVQTPGYMRAPYEHMAAFAMETAVDELAYRVDMDPVALRLANDTQIDPISKLPLSSRNLAECLNRGAEMFGWAKRPMAARSLRETDGTMVGWGVAAGAYKAATAPAIARITATDTGRIMVAVAGHEMGQGIRTAIAITVAGKLGVQADSIDVDVGDTRGTPQHLTAGSWGTATAVPAADEAADALLASLRVLGGAGTPAEILKRAGRPTLSAEIRRKAPGQPDAVFERLAGGMPAAQGPTYPDFAAFSYVAHFVEVRIEPGTRRIRVPRVVSVADCGRVISPRTAQSQMLGAVVWGIGAALREESEVDPRFGGFLNADLAEYAIPVNADIGSIQVAFVDKPDPRINSLGVKGLGEVAMVGVAPAIANAIHHATGRRLNRLPFRVEHVLQGI
ncbi:xanthine dehydrogenase family protein molybdopterin-binding subunit [Sphingomonas sp. HF-S4]|uniref:Xanthine dehydrogenase family protein molybdopterin-binding subunit n=1 Tax=Sphingomonas agrestis TaxID=3080540 RepID=A0ABU3Y4E9_9SPHN|nr:xanthine dehydrogenase family protein molybdopterin-binding subunit [Sphingomonas sp. HF-S4]MDV3456219.1 xanthine dehydrogenase family protein molybdopterin-binding subunit [Sphingomonas sp. HF-S4]